VATIAGAAPIARPVAARFAVPPTQLPPRQPTACHPSAGSQGRQTSQATVSPTSTEPLAQPNAPRARGPSARIARRSQPTISRNTRAGIRRADASCCTPWIGGDWDHAPARARRVVAA
jgi:hypothetical protein